MRDIDPAVQALYEAPNDVELSSLDSGSSDLIRVLVSRLTVGKRTLLPARVEGETRWYGIAGTDRDGRLLAEEMDSWLGPPVGSGASIVGTSADLVDENAARLVGNGVLLRAGVAPGWQREARENVRLLVDLWALTPERSSDAPRPVGRVLRYFYEAIAARDRRSATDALEEIRAGMLLSATNLRFLRVELLGRLGTAEELRSDPLLSDISQFRRPPAVTDHLAQAADTLFIPSGAECLGRDEWRSISLEIEGTWPGLIQHPSQIRCPYGARCLALSELLAEVPRSGVVESLRSNWVNDALVAGVLDSLQDVPEQVSVEDLAIDGASVALGHYRRGDFENVLDIAEQGEPDRGVAALVMHAALNLGDSLAAARALAVVERLALADRETLFSQAVESALYSQLVERNQGAQIPDGWVDWLRGEWPDRPDLLDDWSSKWGTSLPVSVATADLLAGELLDALHDNRRGRVRNGLPALVRWLVAGEGLRPSSVPLAVTIVDIMLGSDPGRSERRAAQELLSDILLLGCSVGEYRTVVAALRGQLALLGPREVDWLAGAMDVQLLNAVPEPRLRDEFFTEALGIAVSWFGRLSRTDAILLKSLFADVGLEFGVPSDDDVAGASPRGLQSFACVGIYSLSESAAQNAGRWIGAKWPDVEVRLSHAHSNSSELESFVGASDVVLMQTSHAKHAATRAIENSIEEARLVRVNGRGATSLFRGLLDWAASDAPRFGELVV